MTPRIPCVSVLFSVGGRIPKPWARLKFTRRYWHLILYPFDLWVFFGDFSVAVVGYRDRVKTDADEPYDLLADLKRRAELWQSLVRECKDESGADSDCGDGAAWARLAAGASRAAQDCRYRAAMLESDPDLYRERYGRSVTLAELRAREPSQA